MLYWVTSYTTAPDIAVRFFANDQFATNANVHLVGQDSLIGTDDFISTTNGSTYVHVGHVEDRKWYYTDEDDPGGEFHIQLINNNIAHQVEAGDMSLEFIYIPEIPR